MKQAGLRDYYTKSQLAEGEVPANALGKKFLNSYSPEGGWYVLGIPEIYTVGSSKGTDHASPYTYDTHVPLAFYGLPFHPGTYRKMCIRDSLETLHSKDSFRNPLRPNIRLQCLRN